MTTDVPGRRRGRVALGAALLGASIFFGWWVLSEDDSVAEQDIEDVRFPELESMAPPGRRGEGPDVPGTPGAPGVRGADGREHRTPPDTVSALDLYLEQSIYPPTSRPLTYESHSDLIDWNARAEQARPTDTDREVTFLFTADRLMAIGDVPVRSVLDVRRDGQPIEVEIHQATATVFTEVRDGPDEEGVGIPLSYDWGGSQYVNVFRPATLEGIERTVRVRLAVQFEFGGEMPQGAFLDLLYTPVSSQPARFTGEFREVIEDGSLVVYAGIEVLRPGWFNIDANLWDAEEEPLVWSRHKADLTTATTEIPLRFFGKAILDSGASPPFTVAQLRGIRYDAERSPSEDVMPPYEGTYRTRSVSLDDLSDDEYQDPRRELIADSLRREQAEGRGPRAPVESVETGADRRSGEARPIPPATP